MSQLAIHILAYVYGELLM